MNKKPWRYLLEYLLCARAMLLGLCPHYLPLSQSYNKGSFPPPVSQIIWLEAANLGFEARESNFWHCTLHQGESHELEGSSLNSLLRPWFYALSHAPVTL